LAWEEFVHKQLFMAAILAFRCATPASHAADKGQMSWDDILKKVEQTSAIPTFGPPARKLSPLTAEALQQDRTTSLSLLTDFLRHA
jgi:hypothetical protein